MPPPHHHHHDHHHDHGHHHHHHHHHPYHEDYDDLHWTELPNRGLKAAKVLGYTKATWDGDESCPYDEKKFSECSIKEKHAAMILGKDPIEEKYDIWWSEADEETQKHAQVLGWDQHKWDDDWEIQDLDCEEWWWKDMTEEQREAAQFFGYDKYLWDEIEPEDDEDYDFHEGDEEEEVEDEEAEEEEEEPEIVVEPSEGETEEKKDNNDEEEEDGDDSGSNKKKKKKKQSLKDRLKLNFQKRKDALLKFSQSEYYGNTSGDEFNHGNNRHIDEMTIYSDKNMIHGIAIQYKQQALRKEGSCAASGGDTFKFRPGEYIVSVKIRTSNKNVTGLTFLTSKHCTMGPLGGSKGDEVEVKAPSGCVLCGLMGYSGKHINALAFRWGPKPMKK